METSACHRSLNEASDGQQPAALPRSTGGEHVLPAVRPLAQVGPCQVRLAQQAGSCNSWKVLRSWLPDASQLARFDFMLLFEAAGRHGVSAAGSSW